MREEFTEGTKQLAEQAAEEWSPVEKRKGDFPALNTAAWALYINQNKFNTSQQIGPLLNSAPSSLKNKCK
jgi:hypothetical protein